MGELITYPCEGATAKGYRSFPAPSVARGRGVVVIQEWWGLVSHIRNVADNFAHEGYHVLAPDLYHGATATTPEEAKKLRAGLDLEQAAKEMRGAIERLRFVTGRAVATVGFSMGGALGLAAACANPRDVAACIVYYAGHPKVTYDVDRLTAPVLGQWAEDDDFANPGIPRLEALLSENDKVYEFHTYPGTRHGFFNDDLPDAYDRDAAVRSWERTIDHLTRNL